MMCTPKCICSIYINSSVTINVTATIYTVILRITVILPSIRVMLLSVINDYLIDGMLHGFLFIFWTLMSGLFGGIANLLIPILLTTNDVIYPQLNILSLLILVESIVIVVFISCLMEYVNGIGWTLYTPLSIYTSYGDMFGIDIIMFSLVLIVISSTLTIINFITTIICVRISSCTLLTVNVWIIVGMFIGLMMLLVVPVVTVLVIFIFVEIHMYGLLFDSIYGGDVLLFQHLFWLFGHPEVYILIFPGISMLFIVGNIILFVGINSVCVGCTCYTINTGIAMFHIFVLGMYVWCHHMWSIDICIDVIVCYSVLSLLVSVPTGLKSVLIMLLLS